MAVSHWSESNDTQYMLQWHGMLHGGANISACVYLRVCVYTISHLVHVVYSVQYN